MSSVNFMEKILDGVEVKWKPLGKVLVRTKGTKITAGQMKELHKYGAPLKVFAGGRTVAFVDFGDIPAKDVNREPLLSSNLEVLLNLSIMKSRFLIRMKCGHIIQKMTTCILSMSTTS